MSQSNVVTSAPSVIPSALQNGAVQQSSIDPSVQSSLDMQRDQVHVSRLSHSALCELLHESREARITMERVATAVAAAPSAQVKTMTVTKKVLLGVAVGAGGFAVLTGAVVAGNVLSRPRLATTAKPVAIIK